MQDKVLAELIVKIYDDMQIRAYELDDQVLHMGYMVNLKSWKDNVDVIKRAIAYQFDALKEE